jgi:8-hydroxy-5-deazaflavin:NADPH oxidoreductase
MRIGILGSGDVSRKLADGFIELGHTVKIGTRDPSQEKIVEWIANHKGVKIEKEITKDTSATTTTVVSVGSFAEAALFGELNVLATSWDGASNAINMADSKNFAGKVLIDVTNPLDFSKGIPPKLSVGHTDSAGEIVQRLLPDARVVKAFNIVGNIHMVHPDFHQERGGPPTMFICGNDDEAKKVVTDNFLAKFGWETIDIGGIEGARLLEPLAMLWITYYFKTNNGNHAFKLLRK